MNKPERKETYSYRLEPSIYQKAEKIIKEKTGLGVGAFMRMQLIKYLNENENGK